MNDPGSAHDAVNWDMEQLLALFNDPATADAELASHGFHPVSILYDTLEDREGAGLITQELTTLAQECGTLVTTFSCGCPAARFLFTGPDVDAAVTMFITRVRATAPSGWRISTTAHPS
ncbi:MAG: hypothetical protein ACRDNF_10710 [Streptosporangiaceae bacterium]